MNGYVVYLAVQKETAEYAHQARPGARIYQVTDMQVQGGRRALLRRQLSHGLRQLADRVEPRPVTGSPAVVGR